MIKYILIFIAIICFGCNKLEFYGDTFYTVTGKIVDQNNNPVPNFKVRVEVSKYEFSGSLYGDTEIKKIIGSGITDTNGNFKFSFPNSNGQNFIVLEEGFTVLESSTPIKFENNFSSIEMPILNEFVYNLKIIKIKIP